MVVSRLDRRNVLDSTRRSRPARRAFLRRGKRPRGRLPGQAVARRARSLRARGRRLRVARDRRRHPQSAAPERVVRCPASRRGSDERAHDRRDRSRFRANSIRQPLHPTAARGRGGVGVLAGSRFGLWFGGRAKARWLKCCSPQCWLSYHSCTSPRSYDDKDSDALLRLEIHVGRLFSVGVALSALLLAIGLALDLFAPGPLSAKLLNAGLLVLMATPMLRVLLSVVEYVRMGDWFFAGITIAVVAELSVACNSRRSA